jgi:DNA invertase Pin-like site-specific DNA recombinase
MTSRCVIYTRKSSEEGLGQDFNSLDAQREACTAFIASQKHEGWSALEETYEDGGFSGGTLQRPGLQKLLADCTADKIDTIVVYKIDRLTRALSDFAKMVELFDTHKVTFVSVTQQFNTTTSMGRLTLNVLLSFAQFEREVTGERIRDKIAVSKAKGMWMGGHPMSPSHSNKKGKRYRYYLSQAVIQGKTTQPDTLTKIPAPELEALLLNTIPQLLQNDAQLTTLCPSFTADHRQKAPSFAKNWVTLPPHCIQKTSRSCLWRF